MFAIPNAARFGRSGVAEVAMVEFSLRTPLGIPVDDQDFDRVFLELERTGRLARLTPETITGAIRSLARDAVLQHASGRWRPGQADPADFVPGDAAAIRAIVCDAIVGTWPPPPSSKAGCRPVAANPDPSRPWPASLDRIRGAVRGWRHFADLGPLADNVAAALAWAPWRQPPSTGEIPPNLPDRQLRKALKHNSVRVRERQGALVGVHVLDLGRTLTQAGSRPEDRQSPATGRGSPIPHLRSGHFRRVRVGPRASFHYETRWIPPVWVQGDPDRAAQRLVVRRLPPPATWTRTPGQEPHSVAEPGHPSPAVAAETPAPPTHQQVASQDPLGIDLQ